MPARDLLAGAAWVERRGWRGRSSRESPCVPGRHTPEARNGRPADGHVRPVPRPPANWHHIGDTWQVAGGGVKLAAVTYAPPPSHALPGIRRLAVRGGLVACLGAVLASTACRPAPLLHDVSITPTTITPDGDGDGDVALIRYAVGQTAAVSIRLVASSGQEYVWRADAVRAPGNYESAFGGIVAGRMVPQGAYHVLVTARTAGGETAQAEGELVVSGGDREPPTLSGFTVLPKRFTPNQDGLDDRVSISYRLEERAEVRIWLQTPGGDYVTDILAAKSRADDPGAIGPHVYEYDAGVDADAPPPPDGDYLVVAEARDGVGNVARAEAPLTIRDGGQPRAGLQGDVAWSARVVPLGGTLWFTATVANVGATPLRTRGPEPGAVYANNTSFNQSAPAGILLLARHRGRSAARSVLLSAVPADVRLDLARRGSAEAPGEATAQATGEATGQATGQGAGEATGQATGEATGQATGEVTGEATGQGAGEEPGAGQRGGPEQATGNGPAAAPPFPLPFAGPLGTPSTALEANGSRIAETGWRGTICGTVLANGQPQAGADVYAFESDGDNGQHRTSDGHGRFCFADLLVPPAAERSYARSPGAVRLGLEYDEARTDLEYPYRWQVGRSAELGVCEAQDRLYLCLLPGQTVTVTGGVRFVERPYRRSTLVYLALLHEDVRRMHGPYGEQRITIEY